MLLVADIKNIVVHCSDSDKDTTKFMQVDFWHKERGFHAEKTTINGQPLHIGYHAFIDGKGVVTEGRRRYGNLIEQGAAQLNMNHNSIGVCIALKKGQTPNTAQVVELKKYIVTKMKEFNIKSTANVIGHRDVAVITHDPSVATECPTDILYNILQNLKKEISEGK